MFYVIIVIYATGQLTIAAIYNYLRAAHDELFFIRQSAKIIY